MLLLFVAAAKAIAELGHKLGKLQDFCPVRGSDGFVWGQDVVFCTQLFSVPSAGQLAPAAVARPPSGKEGYFPSA